MKQGLFLDFPDKNIGQERLSYCSRWPVSIPTLLYADFEILKGNNDLIIMNIKKSLGTLPPDKNQKERDVSRGT